MDEFKTYLIGNKEYEQRPLVYGQVSLLFEILKLEDVEICRAPSAAEILEKLESKTMQLLAVVLTPKDSHSFNKDLQKLTNEIETNITLKQIQEIILDFFAINPIAANWQAETIIGGKKLPLLRKAGSA